MRLTGIQKLLRQDTRERENGSMKGRDELAKGAQASKPEIESWASVFMGVG